MALQGIEVEGVIIKEYPAKEGTSQRTGNAWKSQEFVIQTKDQYPRACLHVWLDINARAWQDRYFNDINCYQCDHVDPNAVNAGVPPMSGSQLGGTAPVSPAATTQQTTQDPLNGGDSSNGEDLPF